MSVGSRCTISAKYVGRVSISAQSFRQKDRSEWKPLLR